MSLIDPYRQAAGDLTAAEEIAGTVVTQTLPMLNQALAHMLALQQVWIVNDIEAEIIAAATAGEPLAGFSPADWAIWGEALRQTFTWLDTPIEAMGGKTPRQAFVRRYVRVPEVQP